MHVLAPGKINLHLRVGKIRSDGFHPLLSWMCTIGLCDEITFEPSDVPGIRLTSSDPSLPTDGRNLIIRAATLLRESVKPGEGQNVSGLDIKLVKKIPSGAGLGGGSSDAGATLMALNQLWRLDRNEKDLSSMATAVGSDVPFFLRGPSAICSGRGEQVSPIERPACGWALIVLPEIALSTPEVYQKYDTIEAADDRPLHNPPDWSHWPAQSSKALLPLLINDLEKPAFALCPKLAELRIKIESIVGRPVRMSGSGSSLFTLFDDQKSTDEAAQRVGKDCAIVARAVPLTPSLQNDLSEN